MDDGKEEGDPQEERNLKSEITARHRHKGGETAHGGLYKELHRRRNCRK